MERRPQARNRNFFHRYRASVLRWSPNAIAFSMAVRAPAKMAARRHGRGHSTFEATRDELGAPVWSTAVTGRWGETICRKPGHEGDRAVALVACLDAYEV